MNLEEDNEIIKFEIKVLANIRKPKIGNNCKITVNFEDLWYFNQKNNTSIKNKWKNFLNLFLIKA